MENKSNNTKQKEFDSSSVEITGEKEIVNGTEYIIGDTTYLKGEFNSLSDAIKYIEEMSKVDPQTMLLRYSG
ncbi:MAG: hypothetical protein IPN13_17100 [Bacteroidetes bacterium]|nr:hypothetical protein [Bacteroidota bacterium]